MAEESNVTSKHYPDAARPHSIGLCLSGGGYRAALFHLGALRRLNELEILSKIDSISSVSGGSIISAHLAARIHPWPERQAFMDWENEVAAPFREFVCHDIRTGPVLKRLLPWNWFRPTTQVNALAARYRKDLTGMTLADLPEHPNFYFCATDLVFGVNWIFERGRVGDYQAGYFRPEPTWPVAHAVAASSCFPPVFAPWNPPVKSRRLAGGMYPPGPKRDRLTASIRLSDGGVYDNMGTEPVWKDHKTVLVSDGGAPFRFEAGKTPLRRLGRYLSVISNQSAALRKRWLISNFKSNILGGTYWGIGSDTKAYPVHEQTGYSKELIDGYIARIRTDLDHFTHGEIAVLENHGYLLADAAVKSHLAKELYKEKPLVVPHGEWMDETRVIGALRDSHKRRLFRRGD